MIRFLSRNIINQKGPDCKISTDLSSSSQILSSASSNTLPSSLVNFLFQLLSFQFQNIHLIRFWKQFRSVFFLCWMRHHRHVFLDLLNVFIMATLKALSVKTNIWSHSLSVSVPASPLTPSFCPGEWVILSSFFACLVILLLDPERSG